MVKNGPYNKVLQVVCAFKIHITDGFFGCSCALTWSMHLIIFVNNAMSQANGFALIINQVLVSWHC